MVKVDLRHIHRVKRRLANGSVRHHHYAWRGGPKFWTSNSDVVEGSAEYLAAFAACATLARPVGPKTPEMVDRYLDSAEFQSKSTRTQDDYRLWALRLAKEFRDDPAALFEDPDSRGEVNRWRDRWAHSPKQFDMAGTVTTLILNWAVDRAIVRQHHCHGFRKIYSTDRSHIFWRPEHIEALDAIAPEWVRRILTVATETGLRPGDLIHLGWQHVEDTPQGRRLLVRTSKGKRKGRTAAIPVTPRLAAVLDATPRDRLTILVSERGLPLTEHRASEGVRQWRNKAGLTPEALGYDLRLYDARGTAATRLLRAGAELKQIASVMGWSVRHAAAVIERYAAIVPEDSDDVLDLLTRARAAETGT